MKRSLGIVLQLGLGLSTLLGCSGGFDQKTSLGAASFHVDVTSVNGSAQLPTADAPLATPPVGEVQHWEFTVEARSATGEVEDFDGYVRLSVRPGAVLSITAPDADGRNMKLSHGKGGGEVDVVAVYGPTSLWAEDLGYTPAPTGTKAKCSNGIDDDGDGLIDYPSDPGCAFANDNSEDGGNFAAGASAPVHYALPRVSDVRGHGSATPYPYEAIEVNAAAPQRLIVTRVASDGFYVTDIAKAEMDGGYNSIFAFNFSTPAGMRPCDRVTYLSGTANDFFGFTELSFPSYQLSFPVAGKDYCEIPEPIVLDSDKPPPATCQLNTDCPSRVCSNNACTANLIPDPIAMQKLQSSLVRVEGFHVSKFFGSGLAKNNVFAPGASSCDFNGDGAIDYTDQFEGSCATTCDADPECSEWTAYSARGDFKISLGTANSMIKLNTGSVSAFDPVGAKGQELKSVSGTMRKFSGGSLNWTIEARCADDLVCNLPGCVPAPISSQTACVTLRTQDDNDEGTD